MAETSKPARKRKARRQPGEPLRHAHPSVPIPPAPPGRILDLPIVPGMSPKIYQFVQAFVDRKLAGNDELRERQRAEKLLGLPSGSLQVAMKRQIPVAAIPKVQQSQARDAARNLPTPEASSPQVAGGIEQGLGDGHDSESSDSSDSDSSDDEDMGGHNVSLSPNKSDGDASNDVLGEHAVLMAKLAPDSSDSESSESETSDEEDLRNYKKISKFNDAVKSPSIPHSKAPQVKEYFEERDIYDATPPKPKPKGAVRPKFVVIDLTEDSNDDDRKRVPAKPVYKTMEVIRKRALANPGVTRLRASIVQESPSVSEKTYAPSERLSMAPPSTPFRRKYTTNAAVSGNHHRFTDDDENGRPVDKLRPFDDRTYYRESTYAPSSEAFTPATEAEFRGVARKPDNAVYDVDEIVGEHYSQSKRMFQVRWKDYDELDWVDENACCFPELVKEFREKLAQEDSNSSDDESIAEVTAASFLNARKASQRREASTARFSREVSILGDQRTNMRMGSGFEAKGDLAEDNHPAKKRMWEEQAGSPSAVRSAKKLKRNLQNLDQVGDISATASLAMNVVRSTSNRASLDGEVRSCDNPVRGQQTQSKRAVKRTPSVSKPQHKSNSSPIQPQEIHWPYNPPKKPAAMRIQGNRTGMQAAPAGNPMRNDAPITNAGRHGRDTNIGSRDESQSFKVNPIAMTSRPNYAKPRMRSPQPPSLAKVSIPHNSRNKGPSSGLGTSTREPDMLPANKTPVGNRPGQSYPSRKTNIRHGQMPMNQGNGIRWNSDERGQLGMREPPRRPNGNGTRPHFEVCRNVTNELKYGNGHHQRFGDN